MNVPFAFGDVGVKESDMRFIRSSMAMAMLVAVKECIARMMDLDQLNHNGVAPVRITCKISVYIYIWWSIYFVH